MASEEHVTGTKRGRTESDLGNSQKRIKKVDNNGVEIIATMKMKLQKPK